MARHVSSQQLVVVIALVCLTSCAAPSESIGTAGIENARIERGSTTESDLIAQLGPPQGRGLDSKGRRMLTWNRLDASANAKASIPVAGPFLPGALAVHKRQLAISLDASGRVVDAKLTDEEHGANVFGTTN